MRTVRRRPAGQSCPAKARWAAAAAATASRAEGKTAKNPSPSVLTTVPAFPMMASRRRRSCCRQQGGPGIAGSLQHPGRRLDIREQEGDGPRRETGRRCHTPIEPVEGEVVTDFEPDSAPDASRLSGGRGGYTQATSTTEMIISRNHDTSFEGDTRLPAVELVGVEPGARPGGDVLGQPDEERDERRTRRAAASGACAARRGSA